MKQGIIILIVLVILAIAAYFVWGRHTAPINIPAASATSSGAAAASSSAGVSPMTSTNQSFASTVDAGRAYEVYPQEATGTKQVLGTYTYSTKDLSGGMVQVTLSNPTAGFPSQSVVVTTGQKVYFIERSPRDDSDGKDAFGKDDYLIAVDQQGYILK